MSWLLINAFYSHAWSALRTAHKIWALAISMTRNIDWIILNNWTNQSSSFVIGNDARLIAACFLSAESDLPFVKLYKASQCLRGGVYRKTVWSVHLTTILGLDSSTVLCKFGAMPRSDNAKLHTKRAFKKGVYNSTAEKHSRNPLNFCQHVSERGSFQTQWLMSCFSFSPSFSLHRRSTTADLRGTSVNSTWLSAFASHHKPQSRTALNICPFLVSHLIDSPRQLTEGVDKLHLHAVGYKRIRQLWEETLHGSSHCVHGHILLDQVNVWIYKVKERLQLEFLVESIPRNKPQQMMEKTCFCVP